MKRKTLSEALDELPDGVIVVPINDVERLHNLFLEIFDEHPNPRRNLRKDNRVPSKTPRGISDDEPSSGTQ